MGDLTPSQNQTNNNYIFRSTAGGNPLLAALSKKRKRSTDEEFDEEDYEKDIRNILTRTLADDQLEILKVHLRISKLKEYQYQII